MSDPIRLFATDLDGTLLGNPAGTAWFTRVWNGLSSSERPKLVYNTGRALTDVQARIAQGELVNPDYIIANVGTQIYDVAAGVVLDAYVEELANGWRRSTVDRVVHETVPRAEQQPAAFQSRLKSSWYLHEGSDDELERLEAKLREAGMDSQVIFSNNVDLDILPQAVGKGAALAWLCRRLEVPTGAVLVSGDRGSDVSMFTLPGVRGILVDNAQPELCQAVVSLPIYHATTAHAEGVVQGLEHFGVIPEQGDLEEQQPLQGLLRLIRGQEEPQELTAEERAYIALAYRKGIEALHRNVTPMGFSAASLPDNEVVGVDENYRSVWGRDGAITLIHALDTGDEELCDCARQTLLTLLEYTTPEGQVPANVRIDSREPDYSGVGGICAIDSAMWVVIAAYEYIQRTDDRALLEAQADRLRQIMTWLGSHDSNRDGLLEIPEASDWTDLFGRSYNVLYDEVLWYRANVCMGLLCERLGEVQAASGYLRHSQRIRGRISHAFWPTTAATDERLTSSPTSSSASVTRAT